MSETNASPQGLPEKRGQPVRPPGHRLWGGRRKERTAGLKVQCTSNSISDMPTLELGGPSVFICKVGLFFEFDRSLLAKNPAHGWHTAGGPLPLAPLSPLCQLCTRDAEPRASPCPQRAGVRHAAGARGRGRWT